ncbi:HEAT repeat domain-containing protein [Nodosilinea sp. LEGE 07298]|nr:HEAT repeat domain-containing protein [Nodosilinea sp. LEGE 07298]
MASGRRAAEQIPVLVELRYWQTSVLERIRAFLYQHDPHLNLDDAALNALLRQGRFLLLIDGLNELPSDEARTQLTTFRRDHPKVPMIFTTRDLGLGGDLGIEKKLEMQPLTEPQIKNFIRAYVPDHAEAMRRQLNNRLREFGQTPLLLWMLCEVFQQSPNRQMPTNLAEVFRAFTAMYEDSSVRKHEVALLKGDVRPLSDRRLWKDALKALAALMMQGETPVDFRVAIHRTEAERELGKIFAKEKFPARDILDDLLKYHLLQNRTTDQLEFRHQLIQEYYSAEYLLPLLPQLSDEQLKQGYLNLLKWTEPIALMLALANEEAQALRVVKLAMDDVDLMIGARLAGEVKASLQPKTVGWIDVREIPRYLKVNCWATSHSVAAIAGLLQVLQHQDSAVRRSAADALGNLGSEAAIPALLQALQHQDSDVRMSAADALGNLGSEAAIPALLQALQHQDWYVRGSAADALGNVGSEAAIPGLLQALQHQDWDVRRSAADALGSLGSEAAIPGLLQALQHQNWSVRESAADALGSLGSEAAIPGLLQALQHQDSYVRRRAADALGNVGSEAAIPALLQALQHQDSDVRRSAADALRKVGSDATITDLWQLHLRQPEYYLENAISAIQDRCKFYNYEIWQACLTGQQDDGTPSQSDKTIANSITIQTVEKLTIMSDKAPIFNQQHATIGVNYAAEGSQQDFTQHIHAPEQNFESLLTGYKHFIDELQQQNPHIADETAIIQTIDIEARRIDTRWQNFLNLKRLWNGGKKAAIKVGEHFVESNPWGKGAIAFLEGVSEDVK